SVSISTSYSGDANNLQSSGSSTLTVTQTTSSESISLNPSSVTVGHLSTVSVSVTGVSPTGTVSFSAPSGTLSANSCTLNNGACSVSFTSSVAGSVSISTSYSGDANNLQS